MSGMTDEDIYAFHPVAPSQPALPAPKPRRWPWVLGGLLLLVLVLLIAGANALSSLLDMGRDGVHVSIDGEDLGDGLNGLPALLALLGVGGALLVALLTVLLVVPLTLLLVGLGLALGLGAVLLALALVLALVLSPLWGLLLLAWLLLRKRPAATMAT